MIDTNPDRVQYKSNKHYRRLYTFHQEYLRILKDIQLNIRFQLKIDQNFRNNWYMQILYFNKFYKYCCTNHKYFSNYLQSIRLDSWICTISGKDNYLFSKTCNLDFLIRNKLHTYQNNFCTLLTYYPYIWGINVQDINLYMFWRLFIVCNLHNKIHNWFHLNMFYICFYKQHKY